MSFLRAATASNFLGSAIVAITFSFAIVRMSFGISLSDSSRWALDISLFLLRPHFIVRGTHQEGTGSPYELIRCEITSRPSGWLQLPVVLLFAALLDRLRYGDFAGIETIALKVHHRGAHDANQIIFIDDRGFGGSVAHLLAGDLRESRRQPLGERVHPPSVDFLLARRLLVARNFRKSYAVAVLQGGARRPYPNCADDVLP